MFVPLNNLFDIHTFISVIPSFSRTISIPATRIHYQTLDHKDRSKTRQLYLHCPPHLTPADLHIRPSACHAYYINLEEGVREVIVAIDTKGGDRLDTYTQGEDGIQVEVCKR